MTGVGRHCAHLTNFAGAQSLGGLALSQGGFTEHKSHTSRCGDRLTGGLDLGAGLALSIIEDPVPRL